MWESGINVVKIGKEFGKSCIWIGAPTLQPNLNGAAPLLRKVFSTQPGKAVKSARVYIVGLGLFCLKINGKSADNSVLNPANTDYDKTVLYNVFNVTKLIKSGKNAICVELGNGFYNESLKGWGWSSVFWRNTPRMLFQLDITYLDGSSQSVISDTSWKCSVDGPTAANSIYRGETFDARKDGNFSVAEYDDSAWQNAVAVKAPKGKLVRQNTEPIKRIKTFSGANLKIKNNTVTLPRMIAGWSRIAFRNTVSGQKIIIDYGETLLDDGSVKKHIEEGVFQRDIYICKGGSVEHYEPKFNYKGFQYIQIKGYNEALSGKDIICYSVHNAVKQTGSVQTSNGFINGLHGLMVNTLLNNFQGKPTDTPWLEKNGWLGDVNMALGAMCFNFDMRRFMSKFLNDIRDGQELNGSIPQLVPVGNFGRANAPVWNSVYIFAVEALVNFYGMHGLIPEHYDGMKKLADLDISTLRQRQWIWGEEELLGDWVSPVGSANGAYDENPPEGGSLAATAYVYKMLETMSGFAEALGRSEDKNSFEEARRNIFKAFNAKFYSDGVYDTGWWSEEHAGGRTRYRQTSNVLPLAFKMVPEREVQAVVENLVKDIKAKDYHLDTGIIGTKYILPVLCDYGYADTAFRILTQTTYPSWGFWLENGATSLWEMWESTSRSRNHYFLGTYDEWLFAYLGGIKNVKDGFKTFTVEPLITGDLTNSDISVRTVRGTLRVRWRRTENNVEFNITVPYGSKANFPLADVTLSGGSYTFKL
ncbi:MAG: family 78 glycoside hydrolase catalytic domain [Clostridia bacterium]|nr:family 78 glycoside hydrolase catalytic domain [Clostridia bacterium]